jgi:hypothetical protein
MPSSSPQTHFRPRRVFLVWNFVALIGFAGGLAYVTHYPNNASMRITDLDRVGAIDETKLRVAYPALADNLRYNLGMWVAEMEREAARVAVLTGMAVAVVNIALMLLLSVSRNSVWCKNESAP